MTAPQITHRSPATLTPWPRNARTHSKKQIRQIVASIRQFGFTVPVLIDEAGTILAGHGRVAAATVLGLTTVPCLQLTHLSEAQKRAYVLADNKLALNAGWDEDLLAKELGALLATDLDLDIGVTGFSIPEVDTLLATVAPEESGDPADDALPDTAPARVRRGEVWQLGAHRLICGDVRDPAVLATLMAGEQARLVFTDPPYNVPIDGHAGGLGRITHREFAMAAGECRRPRESEEVWTRIVASVRSLNSSGFLINTKRMDCGRLCETALRVVLQAGVGASCASTPAAASIAPAVVLPRCFG